MATSGKSLAITAGIYAIIALLVFIFFSWWAAAARCRRGASPRRPGAPRRCRSAAGPGPEPHPAAGAAVRACRARSLGHPDAPAALPSRVPTFAPCALGLWPLPRRRWRTTKLTRKFFSPKLFTPGEHRPPPISARFGAWVPKVRRLASRWQRGGAGGRECPAPPSLHAFPPPPRHPPSTLSPHLPHSPAVQVLYMSEAEVIRCGGVDAAMYIKILRMGERGGAAACAPPPMQQQQHGRAVPLHPAPRCGSPGAAGCCRAWPESLLAPALCAPAAPRRRGDLPHRVFLRAGHHPAHQLHRQRGGQPDVGPGEEQSNKKLYCISKLI